MKIRIKTKIDTKKLVAAKAAIREEAFKRVSDVGDSLAMTSSGAAPHDEGILDQSANVVPKRRGFMGAEVTVSYSAVNGGFDYALKMHDGVYKLGPGSRAKPGGKGMSGSTYSVGPKYLERPLHGEQSAYKDHVGKGIVGVLTALDRG